MSSLIAKNLQVGSDPTATNNFTIFQPATPDGTLRIGNGNTGITSSLLTLTSAGNFGIGTSSPGYRFAVVGATSDATPVANFRGYTTGSDGARTAILRFTSSDDNNWALARYDAYQHLWNTNGSEKMRLDSSGNLLVGTTSVLGSQLGVMAQGGNGISFTLRHSSATAGKFRLAGVDSSNNYLVYNNSNVGMYMTDGGTSWTATSDENQKILTDKFVNAAQFLTTVRATRGRYKTDDEITSRSFLVAQDWQQYLPEAISEKDGILGLSYQDVIPVLVAAIQEIKAEFDAYKATHP